MNQAVIDKIIADCTEDCMGTKQVNAEQLVKQTVGETILAILATDCRDFVYTTFDRDRADGTISRVVDQVRNHWGFK